MSLNTKISKSCFSKSDRDFLSYLRGLSIFIIVFGHVGGFWVFRPYSEFLHVFVPVFFFISGAVSFNSYNRSITVRNYYKKRFIGLLVPYYLLCIFALFVFVLTQQNIPIINIWNLLKWIQIRPSSDIMPFPLGQVWFLHTLVIITAISPIYFRIYNRNSYTIYFLWLFIVCLSVIPLFFNASSFIYIFGNNFYKPLIHSSFYIFGMLAFNSALFRKINLTTYSLILSILISVISVVSTGLNINYSFHTFSPDIYYVSGSFSAIFLILLLRKPFLNICRKNSIVESIFMFFYRHTFSIYLLHSFGIFISENVLGLVAPDQKTITYGLTKLFCVLIITCLLAIPYTALSNKISSILRYNTEVPMCNE